MKVCFLLHFHQPSNQIEEVVKKVTDESYAPVIKLIKNNKKIRITANFTLSLLEQLDRYGYSWLIQDIKDLVESGRMELTGSAAYHPLLTKIPPRFIHKQVILNEMSLGYYLGFRKDFEGEDCLMLRGVKGFFPPEMAVNDKLLEEIDELGYDWVAVDEHSIFLTDNISHNSTMCHRLNNGRVTLVKRDRVVSNLISFKRELNCEDVMTGLMKSDSDKLIALDAETFGHHYKDGVDLFDLIISGIGETGLDLTTVTEAVNINDWDNIKEVYEDTWSSINGNIYPLWINPENEINTALWSLYYKIHKLYEDKYPVSQDISAVLKDDSSFGSVPIWLVNYADFTDKSALRVLSIMKMQQSDQFWWTTGAEVMGKVNFSKYMVESVLGYYSELGLLLDAEKEVRTDIESISNLLVKHKGFL